MKRFKILGFLIFLTVVGCGLPQYFADREFLARESLEREHIREWNYIYSYANITQPEWLATIITDEVYRYCKKENLDPYIVARKIWKETRYKTQLVSRIWVWTKVDGKWVQEERECAYGLFQVNLECWRHLLLEIRNGELKSLIKTDEDYKKYAFYISYNTEMGTKILRHYLDMFDDRYDYALTAYMSGEYSKESLQLRKNGIRNEYIDDILNGEAYEEKMRVFNNWKFVEKKQYVNTNAQKSGLDVLWQAVVKK